MNITLVGSSGYIASFLLNRFAEENHIDQVLKIDQGEGADAHLNLLEPEKFDYDKLNEIDYVVFTAAISGPDKCAADFDWCWSINVTGTSYFIKQAIQRGCKVLFFSSDAVFGDIPGQIYDESSETKAETPYGRMKKAVEDEFKENRNFKAIRLSYVASAKDRFISYCLNCIEKGEMADIFHPFYRNVIIVSDVVDVVVWFSKHWDEYEPFVLDVAGKELVSRVRMADELNRHLGNRLNYTISTPEDNFYKNRPRITQMKSLYMKQYGILEDNTFTEKLEKELEISKSLKNRKKGEIRMKKALITGITGMVGSHLADFLLENTDWEVYGVCRWRSPMDNVSHLLDRANKKDRLYFDYADLNDEMSLITVINKVKPDYVFHLAAQSYPLTSFTAPIDTLNTNIIGTCRLLEAIHLAMVEDKEYKPVIHVCASSEVFGKIPAEKKPETGIHEECPFHPASPYAISKVGTDLLGRYYVEAYGMSVMTTRMFTHTGPRRGDVFHESTFAKQIAMIEAGLIEPKVMVGNLQSLRTYADVRDAVRAYYMLVTVNPVAGEYYNIGGSYTCEVGDTLNTLISYSTMKDKIKVEIDPERLRPIDADLQVPDCRKFKAHSGWEPEIPFEKTMRDLLEYWRDRVGKGEKFLTR